MWPAFPTSDYYEGSAPLRGQQSTANLPATGLAGRRGGQPRSGSHVHHRPVDGGGARLFPCSFALGTPQSSPGSPRRRQQCHRGGDRRMPPGGRVLRPGPHPPGWSRFFSLEGVPPPVHSCCTFPSRLPGPSRLAVPARPVVVGAAPTRPCTSRVRLPPASAACCDRPKVGSFLPPGHMAPRGARWRPRTHRGTRRVRGSGPEGGHLGVQRRADARDL